MKLFLLFCFSIFNLLSYSQDKNKFYALDASLQETVLDSSVYLLWVHEIEDSNWQFDYYRTWGPLVKSQTFADREGSVLNGRTSIYNTYGNLDSTGIFSYNKKNGPFIKYISLSKDSILESKHYDYKNDSLIKMVNEMDNLKKQAPGDTSVWVSRDTPIKDSSWAEFLSVNIKYPERARSKNIQGAVYISFHVNVKGDVNHAYIKKSAEYSLDQEALRLIKDSGKWYPDVINGIQIQSEKTKPVNFKLDK